MTTTSLKIEHPALSSNEAIYSLREAANILHISPRMAAFLSGWCGNDPRDYTTLGRRTHGASDDRPVMSFQMLAEVFSRTAIVDLIPTTIADLLRAEHNFLYYLPSLVNAKQIGSAALAILEAVTSIHRADELHAEFCKKLVTERFSRLDFDDRGEVSRLYPFTRASRVNSPKLVVIDPRRRTGRPVLDSCGVPTEMLFERHQAGDSVRELADDYEVNVAEVEEALRYESQQIADTSPPPRGMGD